MNDGLVKEWERGVGLLEKIWSFGCVSFFLA